LRCAFAMASADSWIQRGSCCQCGQRWVLGKVDPASGLYGHFFCAACWDCWGDGASDHEGDHDRMTARHYQVVNELLRPDMLEDSCQIFSIEVGLPTRGRTLRFVDGFRGDAPGPGTGFSVWNGSRILLDYLESTYQREWQQRPERPRVLELGAGCGLTGMGLAQLGAEVVLTDVPTVCPLLTCHVAMNFPCDSTTPLVAPRVETLRWGHQDDLARLLSLEQPKGGFDYVIGSEIAYDPDANQALVQTLHALTSLQTSTCEVPDPSVAPEKRHTRVFMALARRGCEFEDFASQVARARWSLHIWREIDLSAIVGAPYCSPILIVELRPGSARRPEPRRMRRDACSPSRMIASFGPAALAHPVRRRRSRLQARICTAASRNRCLASRSRSSQPLLHCRGAALMAARMIRRSLG